MKPIVSLIVAAAENGVIGLKGHIPWRVVDDIRFFRETTKGRPVIMGRTTHESIGKPLAGRVNIVLTGNRHYTALGCISAASLDDALQQAGGGEIFIIGGANVYKQALERNLVDRIYLTRVHVQPEGDAFFEFNQAEWRITYEEPHEADAGNQYPFTFYTLQKTVH